MGGEVLWYYQFEEGRAGPETEERIADLIAEGVILRDTLVWREGMSDWQEAYLTDLSRYFTVEAPGAGDTGTAGRGWVDYLTSRNDLPRKLRVWYFIFGISLCVSVFMAILGPIIWLAALVSTFFGLLIMYHVWSVIPAQKRLFSPLSTVLLMIIPLFNMVWIFYCYYAAAKKVNSELKTRGITEDKINEYISLGYAVSCLLMTVLFVLSAFTGMMLASLSMALIVVIVFFQVFMLRSFVISIVRLL